MDFKDVLKNRYSCRNFDPDKGLTREQLDFIKYAIDRTPSAGNLRAFEVLLIIPSESQHQLARATGCYDLVNSAACNLVFLAAPLKNMPKYGKRGLELYSIQDATIACTHAHLAATSLGLGSCWVGAFNDKEVMKALDIQDFTLRPVAILSIGILK